MRQKLTFWMIACVSGLLMNCVPSYAGTDQTFDANAATELLREAGCCIDDQVPLDNKEMRTFRKWESGPTPNLYVGAIAATPNEDGLVGCIGVFRQTASGPVLLDSTLTQFEGNMPAWNYSISLDFAPYRLNEQETAFGARYHNSYQSTAHGEASDNLYLYRFRDGHLSGIFNVMTLDAGGNTDGTDHYSHHRIVSISTKKHKGFFDLIVKDKKTKKTSVSCWNGSAYAKCKRSHE